MSWQQTWHGLIGCINCLSELYPLYSSVWFILHGRCVRFEFDFHPAPFQCRITKLYKSLFSNYINHYFHSLLLIPISPYSTHCFLLPRSIDCSITSTANSCSLHLSLHWLLPSVNYRKILLPWLQIHALLLHRLLCWLLPAISCSLAP